MNTICVLGLGYIGLPTGSMFALAGKDVVGVDPNPRVQAALKSGQVPIDEPELETLVTAAAVEKPGAKMNLWICASVIFSRSDSVTRPPASALALMRSVFSPRPLSAMQMMMWPPS